MKTTTKWLDARCKHPTGLGGVWHIRKCAEITSPYSLLMVEMYADPVFYHEINDDPNRPECKRIREHAQGLLDALIAGGVISK